MEELKIKDEEIRKKKGRGREIAEEIQKTHELRGKVSPENSPPAKIGKEGLSIKTKFQEVSSEIISLSSSKTFRSEISKPEIKGFIPVSSNRVLIRLKSSERLSIQLRIIEPFTKIHSTKISLPKISVDAELIKEKVRNSHDIVKKIIQLLAYYISYSGSHLGDPSGFIYGCNLITGLKKEEIEKMLVDLGLISTGWHSSRAYCHQIWKVPEHDKILLDFVRRNPKDFGLKEIDLKGELIYLKNDPVFNGFLEWLGKSRRKYVEEYGQNKEIKKFDEIYGINSFKEMVKKLVEIGALVIGYFPHRSRAGKRRSSPAEYIFSLTNEAKEVLNSFEEVVEEEEKRVREEFEEEGGENILDFLFEPIDEEHDLKGILHASSERPIIILAEKSEDDYIDALKLILREIYRIKVGGFPEAIVTKKEKEEVEEVKAEGRIHVIDDDLEDKFFGFFKSNKVEDLEKVDMDKLLEERIPELFGQGFGFLVFYLKKENFDFLCNSFGIKEHKIQKLILTKGKELKEDEREKISSASWGLLEPNGSWRSLSDYFSGYEKKFYNKLEKMSSSKYAISVRESVEDEEGGRESNLHYLLKIFLVKYFREKLKIEGKIETETEKEGIIPDIFIPGENLAIEVETLYGTGIATLRKLGRTIEKYEEKGYKLWVVMPNLQLLLFSKDIREVIRTFENKIKELKFFGIDLDKQELVPLDEFTIKTNYT